MPFHSCSNCGVHLYMNMYICMNETLGCNNDSSIHMSYVTCTSFETKLYRFTDSNIHLYICLNLLYIPCCMHIVNLNYYKKIALHTLNTNNEWKIIHNCGNCRVAATESAAATST